MTWAPRECTLPLSERPSGVEEPGDLFTTVLPATARPEPTLLPLTLDGPDRIEATSRDLVARETACCSPSDFTLTRAAPGGALELVVRAPALRVLDELAARATPASAGGPA